MDPPTAIDGPATLRVPWQAMKRPYLAPKDDGGPEHVVNVDLGRRSGSKAPWDGSTPGSAAPHPRGRPLGSGATPSPRRQGRPAPSAPPEPAPGKLSIDASASATAYSKEDAESFWSLPSVPAVRVPEAAPLEAMAPLSGPADEFDVSTGWTYEAVVLPDDLQPELGLTAAERARPVLPSADEIFGVSAETPAWAVDSRPASKPAVSAPGARDLPEPGHHRPPPPPPRAAPASSAAQPSVDVEALLTRGRELLSSGDLEQAARLLRHARRAAPEHNSVATWLEFAERGLLREHLPSARPDSVPTLAQDPRALAAQATPLERQLIGSLATGRPLDALLAAGNDEAFVPMLKMLATFEARAWITWA
jgi:hypothetical protein